MTVQFLTDRYKYPVQMGIILGSGLRHVVDDIDNPVVIPYQNVPYFPTSTVSGHAGQMVLGKYEGKHVCVMQGRFHLYEGYRTQQVTYPVLAMRQLGISNLIVTNAAGGINPTFRPGDLMVISDHINLMGTNPLVGLGGLGWGPQFPNMVDAYCPHLRALAHSAAQRCAVSLHEGVYAGMLGPSYETPAEITLLGKAGADAVGMSTVPEVIVARYLGINVLGISCITNLAAGLTSKLSHAEVEAVAKETQPRFSLLLRRIIDRVK